ncbi:MAG: hypothetical protein AAGC74_03500 [Verrucomicrobiota bacterium]
MVATTKKPDSLHATTPNKFTFSPDNEQLARFVPHQPSLFRVPSEPIITEATVLTERDQRTVFLQLKNGKTTLGHLSKAHLHLRPLLTPQQRVRVEMTPFDFEKARIVAVLERESPAN